jgi:hypothetical protein
VRSGLIACEVQDARVAAREDERQGPGRPVLVRLGESRVDGLRLHRAQVQLVDRAAVDRLGVERVGHDVVALAPRRDLAEVRQVDPVQARGAAGHARAARVLLRTVDPVGESAVGRDPVDLRGRLVVPGAPGLPAVQRDDRTLVGAEDLATRVCRVDPQLLVVVAARRALHDGEAPAAVVRAQQVGVESEDRVRVRRVDRDAAEVPAALPDALVAAGARPVVSAVVGAVEASLSRVHHRVHALRRGRRQREADPPVHRRQAVSIDAPPCVAGVR